ncbi:MAG: NAD(P)-dependent oxidoreductase [Gemmiger sp.]|nr:NAD(P)-dependent oxidoreductase [Gemmiger sp.]
MHKTFCVVGTDARQHAAARVLREAGYQVTGAEGAGNADYILLPMPLDADMADLARILRAAQPGTLALGGRVSGPVQAAADAAGVELVDYFLRPELACLNAVPTAEGCLGLLMALREDTLWESPVLVLGGGRVAHALYRRLVLLGAAVTVVARAPLQRAEARCQGCHTADLSELPRLLPGFDAVVNTIPSRVLGRAELARLPGRALVIDLASMPGGTDFEAAKSLSIKAVHALSLPAHCAPHTAGRLVADTVLNILQERSVAP